MFIQQPDREFWKKYIRAVGQLTLTSKEKSVMLEKIKEESTSAAIVAEYNTSEGVDRGAESEQNDIHIKSPLRFQAVRRFIASVLFFSR